MIEMAKIANDPEADPQMRFNANKEVAQYVTPKLKASEVNMNVEGRVVLDRRVKRLDGTTGDD